MKQTIAQAIANAISARKNCWESNNKEWFARWNDRALMLVRDYLPSGSGIDCGTALDLDKSSDNALRFTFSFHHMDENGFYCGWTEHKLIVKPSFSGVSLHITGPDRNEIKEYLYQIYECALSQEAPNLIAQLYRITKQKDNEAADAEGTLEAFELEEVAA